MSGIKRFLFWDYPRACWQYDVMVAIILAFIFLPPRGFFRDQPRASSLVRLPAEHGANVYWLEPDFFPSAKEPERVRLVEETLKSRFGKHESLVRLEPIYDSEREVKGYMAFTRP